jgi:FAD/FMN-containing dehydrogenase
VAALFRLTARTAIHKRVLKGQAALHMHAGDGNVLLPVPPVNSDDHDML